MTYLKIDLFWSLFYGHIYTKKIFPSIPSLSTKKPQTKNPLLLQLPLGGRRGVQMDIFVNSSAHITCCCQPLHSNNPVTGYTALLEPALYDFVVQTSSCSLAERTCVTTPATTLALVAPPHASMGAAYTDCRRSTQESLFMNSSLVPGKPCLDPVMELYAPE